MKCHYEVLEVARNASTDELKKAYRKLALKWHPDKNLDNIEDAKEHFQLVQLAWEVLSDPQQRAWYDKHRKAILEADNGEDYKADSIDLFQYFTSTCFRGYGDDEKGFYTVYRTLFEKLAAEDAKFSEVVNQVEAVPSFGNSNSSYEEIVHNFYAYWQSYNTKVTFAWLQPYDIRQAPNRQILRLMEKDNKKVRDSAKRERNEQVRNLVALVRKRDKRVQAHIAELAARAKDNIKKTEEWKRQQLIKRQRQLMEHKESEWSKFSNIESELKNIEANLNQEFGDDFTSDNDIDDENVIDSNSLYCVACTKIFKTQKAFTNHENSKKHKENIAAMKASMVKEDEEFESYEDSDVSSYSNSELQQRPATDSQIPDFLLNSTQNNVSQVSVNSETSEEELMSDDEDADNSSKAKDTTKNYSEGIKLATGPQMDDALYSPPKVAENDNDYATSEDELISDQEEEDTIPPKKQKEKKKRKENIRNSVIKQINEEDVNINEDILMSKKQRKKQYQKRAVLNRAVDKSQLSPDVTTNEYGEVVENTNIESTDEFYQQPTDPAFRLQKNHSLPIHSKLNKIEESITSKSEDITTQSEETVQSGKHKKRKERKKSLQTSKMEDMDNKDLNFHEDSFLSKRQRRKIQQKQEWLSKYNNGNPKSQGDILEEHYKQQEEDKNTISLKKESEITNNKSETTKVLDLAQSCFTCKAEFPSKNKLFEHLKTTGHSVYVSTLQKTKRTEEKASKGKKNTDRRKH